ncbi:MAG TPA: hypothetical protein VHM91_14260 [Verrucomicrobiales bacterium]|nr:hypothetical protein [Verrucomicrobiales bacterium]
MLSRFTATSLPSPRDASELETVERLREEGLRYELLLRHANAQEAKSASYRLIGVTAGPFVFLIVSVIRELHRRRNAPRVEAEARLLEAEREAAFKIRAAAARQRTGALWRKDHPGDKTVSPVS